MAVGGVLLCLVCLMAIVSCQHEHFEQRMVDRYGSVIPYKHDLPNGRYCINSVECTSGCCLSKKSGRRCAPLSQKGEKCNKFVVKGQIYLDHCPCKTGEDSCSSTERFGTFGRGICSS